MNTNELLATKIFALAGSTVLIENLANGVRVQFTYDRYHKSVIGDTELLARENIAEAFISAMRDGFHDLFKEYADKEYHVIITTARTEGQREGYDKLIEDKKVFGEQCFAVQDEITHMSGFDAVERLTKVRPADLVYSGSVEYVNIPIFSDDQIVAKIKFTPDFAAYGFMLEATGNLISVGNYESEKVYASTGKLAFIPRFVTLNGLIRYIAFDVNIKES